MKTERYVLMVEWPSDGHLDFYAWNMQEFATVEEAREARRQGPDFVRPLKIVKLEVVE